MKVYLVRKDIGGKPFYYLKKGRWSSDIYCESYFTKQAAHWHRTFWLNDYNVRLKYEDKPEDIVIEEYEMIKIN